jgi:magnesium transporter
MVVKAISLRPFGTCSGSGRSPARLLTGSLDIYLSAVANRTNEVIKVLTIYGTLALPLVVITGFFGMNLHLPWSNNLHGLRYASALMVFSIVGVLWYFKRKRWF